MRCITKSYCKQTKEVSSDRALEGIFKSQDTSKAPESVVNAALSVQQQTKKVSSDSAMKVMFKSQDTSKAPIRAKGGYPCPQAQCSHVAVGPAKLKIHMASHTKERPFVCGYRNGSDACMKNSKTQDILRRHQKIEAAPKHDYVYPGEGVGGCDDGCSQYLVSTSTSDGGSER